ncbi:MAG: hypothetical protein FJ029_08415 [Actinobacteria bacterium]|nr:hypothetical protein [Actinomycetota bacterium]
MAPSIGYVAETVLEVVCARCGRVLVLQPRETLKPCPSCMNIHFNVRDRAAEAARAETPAQRVTRRADHLLERHANWLSPHQRQGLARALGELLAELTAKVES